MHVLWGAMTKMSCPHGPGLLLKTLGSAPHAPGPAPQDPRACPSISSGLPLMAPGLPLTAPAAFLHP